ncbi:MAG TPA: transketolase [Candidatus Paceibacterota bacterium]
MLTDEKKKFLELKANEIRRTVIETLVNAGSGHTAGPLSSADILTYLFFQALSHEPKKPDWPERDRLIVSNGHICPVLYSVMAHAGYFPVRDLINSLRKFGSSFQGHPHREFLAGLETSSGPLGEGLSQAVGMALAERIDSGGQTLNPEKGLTSTASKHFFCILSDAELQEGNIWEAAMLAGKERLGNLIAIIDRNKIQIGGFTEKIMPLEPLREKLEAFGWQTTEINGHDFFEIDQAVSATKRHLTKPSVIIAHTIAGKGVKEFENKPEWHGKAPNKEEGVIALKELKK